MCRYCVGHDTVDHEKTPGMARKSLKVVPEGDWDGVDRRQVLGPKRSALKLFAPCLFHLHPCPVSQCESKKMSHSSAEHATVNREEP